MPLDQDISYRVRLDDSDFQAKLTQMRASVDQVIGGQMGAMGGMSMNRLGGFMGMMQQPGSAGMYSGMGLGGFADFGLGIQPITYTPPAIAMQPHFGMFQVQQTLGRAFNASLGSLSPGLVSGLLGPDIANVPLSMNAGEYRAYSTRQVGDAVSAGAATAAQTALSLGAMYAGTEVGAAIGTAVLPGIGTFVGGAIGGTLGAAYGSTPVGAITEQNYAIQSALAAGSFRFLDPASRDLDPLTGRGFGRGARFDVATSIQHMANEDLRLSGREMGQILESGMQYDMFSGTRDAEDFKTKFKGLVETVKVVASTLHTSIAEGMEAMRGMRDMGLETPGQMQRYAFSTELGARMAGRTGMEMAAIKQAGAEMFRGTGVSMELGAESMQQNMVTIRQMLNQGVLSREVIGHAGGEQALAQQMTAQGLASVQTGYGRAFMYSNYDPATRGLREGAAEGVGSFDIESAAGRLSGMSPASLLHFQVNQREMISKMSPATLQTMSMGMTAAAARKLQAVMPGVDFETAYLAIGENVEHKSREVLDTELAMMKMSPEERERAASSQIEQMYKERAEQARVERYSIGTRIGKSFQRGYQAVADVVGGIGTFFGEAGENFLSTYRGIESFLGGGGFTQRYNFTAGAAKRGEALLAPKRDAKGNIVEPSEAEKMGILGTVTDVTEGGILRGGGSTRTSEIMGRVTAAGGAITEGDALSAEAKKDGILKIQQYNGQEVQTFATAEKAKNYLEHHGGGFVIGADKGGTTVMTSEAYKKSQEESLRVGITKKDEEAGKKKLQEMDIDVLINLKGLGKGATEDEIAAAIFGEGKKYEKLSSTDRAVIQQITKDTSYGFTEAAKRIKAKEPPTGIELDRHLNEISSVANKAKEDASQILKRHGLSGAAGYDPELLRLIGGVGTGEGRGDEELRKYLRAAGKSDQFEKLSKAAASMTAEEKEAYKKATATMDEKAAEARRLGVGADPKGGVTPITGVPKEEMDALKDVAKQIYESMKLVNDLHQQIVARQQGR